MDKTAKNGRGGKLGLTKQGRGGILIVSSYIWKNEIRRVISQWLQGIGTISLFVIGKGDLACRRF